MISTWGVWTRDTGATLPVWPDSASSMEDKSHTVGTFQVGDYVVFALLFVVSSGIGVFFAIKERKKALSKEFLVGGRQMSCGPVALSLTASFMSAVTVIGAPSDVYRYGASYVIFGVAYTFVVFFTAELFLPVFYRSGITSTYEVRIRIFQICFVIKVGHWYRFVLIGFSHSIWSCVFVSLFELQPHSFISFRRWVVLNVQTHIWSFVVWFLFSRNAESSVFLPLQILYTAVVVYAPALALNQGQSAFIADFLGGK